jgi:spore coat protein U-like protein
MPFFFRNRAAAALVLTAGLVALAGIMAAPAEAAGSVTGTIGVSLNVSAACAVNGGTATSGALGQIGAIAFADQPGVFGNVDASLVATGGGSGLSVLCSPGLTPAMTIGAGTHDSSSVHHLANGPTTVAYHLYSDAAHTSEIAIGQQVSLGTSGTSALALPIYAGVNSGGAALPAGAYADTVQVTLSW